jgi:hypothetical protein
MRELVSYWREIVIVVLVGVLLGVNPKSASNTKVEVKEVKVKIPEVVGKFNKPEKQEELPSKGKDSIVFKSTTVYVESKVNKEAVRRYLEAEDKLAIFTEEVRQRDYITDYTDDNIELSVSTSTQGKLISQIPTYKIKEREVKVKETTITKIIEKKDNFGFIIGSGFSQDNFTKEADYEIITGIRVKKVSILGSVNSKQNLGLKVLYEF